MSVSPSKPPAPILFDSGSSEICICSQNWAGIVLPTQATGHVGAVGGATETGVDPLWANSMKTTEFPRCPAECPGLMCRLGSALGVSAQKSKEDRVAFTASYLLAVLTHQSELKHLSCGRL